MGVGTDFVDDVGGTGSLSPVGLLPEADSEVLTSISDAASIDWLRTKEFWWATISVVFSFAPAALAGFPDSLALGIFFAVGTVLANILFQTSNLYKMTHPEKRGSSSDKDSSLESVVSELEDDALVQAVVSDAKGSAVVIAHEKAPLLKSAPQKKSCSCTFLGLPWYHWFGIVPSLIGNLPLAIAASDGYDAHLHHHRENPGVQVLKAMAFIGVLTEAVLSVNAFGTLWSDVEALLKRGRKDSSGKGLVFLSFVLGGLTAIAFSLNGVSSIQEALKHYCPKDWDRAIDSYGMTVGLWVPNLYPLLFGLTFGMLGTFDLISRVLPKMFGCKELLDDTATSPTFNSGLGAWITFLIVASSIGPSVGVQLASKIGGWTALSVFSNIGIGSCILTNTADTTVDAGIWAANKAVGAFHWVKEKANSCCPQTPQESAAV